MLGFPPIVGLDSFLTGGRERGARQGVETGLRASATRGKKEFLRRNGDCGSQHPVGPDGLIGRSCTLGANFNRPQERWTQRRQPELTSFSHWKSRS